MPMLWRTPELDCDSSVELCMSDEAPLNPHFDFRHLFGCGRCLYRVNMGAAQCLKGTLVSWLSYDPRGFSCSPNRLWFPSHNQLYPDSAFKSPVWQLNPLSPNSLFRLAPTKDDLGVGFLATEFISFSWFLLRPIPTSRLPWRFGHSLDAWGQQPRVVHRRSPCSVRAPLFRAQPPNVYQQRERGRVLETWTLLSVRKNQQPSG